MTADKPTTNRSVLKHRHRRRHRRHRRRRHRRSFSEIVCRLVAHRNEPIFRKFIMKHYENVNA